MAHLKKLSFKERERRRRLLYPKSMNLNDAWGTKKFRIRFGKKFNFYSNFFPRTEASKQVSR